MGDGAREAAVAWGRRLRVPAAAVEEWPAPGGGYRLTVHNRSPRRGIYITHIWFDGDPRVHILNGDIIGGARFPGGVDPGGSWSAVVRGTRLAHVADPCRACRVRLSTGRVLRQRLA